MLPQKLRAAEEWLHAIDLYLRLVRGAYEIDFEHELSRAFREAYARSPATTLEPVGKKASRARFAAAGIPTVYHGPVGSGAHADVEYTEVAELVRASEVYLGLLGRLGGERMLACRTVPRASARV